MLNARDSIKGSLFANNIANSTGDIGMETVTSRSMVFSLPKQQGWTGPEVADVTLPVS